MDDRELVIGDHVLLLRGHVLETFHTTGLHQAFHVRHLAVEGKPRRDGDLDVVLGVDVRGQIMNGARLRVPAARQSEVLGFFAEARRRRDG